MSVFWRRGRRHPVPSPVQTAPVGAVIWNVAEHDLGPAIAQAVASTSASTQGSAPRPATVRFAHPGNTAIRPADVNVVLLGLGDTARTARFAKMRDELRWLARSSNDGGARLVVGWVVPVLLRERVWVVADTSGHLANMADLTVASSWTRARAAAATDEAALRTLSTATLGAVEGLADTTALLGWLPGPLLSFIDIADRNAVHLFVCEQLGCLYTSQPTPTRTAPRPDEWNGLDAVEAAIATRWRNAS